MLGTPEKDRVYNVLTSNRAALGKCTANELLLGRMDRGPTPNIVLYHPETSRLSYVEASALDSSGPTGPSGISGTPGTTGPTGANAAQGGPGPTGPIGPTQIVQTIHVTESGPFTIPLGTIGATVVALGGGGGGGSGAPGGGNGAGGGGSTGFPVAYTLSLQPNDVINIVIGAGGSGADGTLGSNGLQGESTDVYYGSTLLISSPGGLGGIGVSSPGESGAGASGPFGGGGGGGRPVSTVPGAGGVATGSGTPPLNYGQPGEEFGNGGAGARGGQGGSASGTDLVGGGGGGGVGGGGGGNSNEPGSAALPNSGAGGGGGGGGESSGTLGGDGGSGRVTITLLLAVPTSLVTMYTLPTAIQTTQLSLNFTGSTLAVGLATPAAGSVLSILTNVAGVYTQQAIPLPPDAVGVNYGAVSLSDSGNVLALGSGSDNGDLGAVWIYQKIAGVWTLQGPKVTAIGEIGLGAFGQQVSISGPFPINGTGYLLAVGSPGETPAGAAYIFNLDPLSNPTLIARLVGTPLDAGAMFGWDVTFSADGSTLAVGASSDLSLAGSFFVFTKILGTWQQQAKLIAPLGFTSLYLGYNNSLSADGNTLASSSASNGVMYYRVPLTSTWSAGSVLPLPYDRIGTPTQYFVSLSQDGNTLCSSFPDNNGNIGASWRFIQGPPGTWTQAGPAFVGTGAPLPITQQGFSKISGNGSVVAVQDNSNQGLVWIFV